MLARRFKNWKLELTDEVIHRLQQHYKYKFAIDLYQAIAEEKLDMAEIKEFITRPKEEERTVATLREEVQVIPSRPISEDVLLIDRNVDNVVYKFARCCTRYSGMIFWDSFLLVRGLRFTGPSVRMLLICSVATRIESCRQLGRMPVQLLSPM